MDPDPWNWTVQDVQNFFRNDAAAYIADRPYGRLPQLPPFLNALEVNEVSGADLLDNMNDTVLRNDCGVPSLVERNTVMHCIKKLQRQSTAYALQTNSFGLQTPPIVTHPAKGVSVEGPAVPRSITTQEPYTILAIDQGQIVPDTTLPADATQVGENVRKHEIQVEDSRGQKRRKLDLSKTTATSTVDSVSTVPVDSGPAELSGYLRNTALPVDQIFFGQTRFGQEIRDQAATGNTTPLTSEDEDFQFTSGDKPAGQTRYVYSQLCRFLNDEDREVQTRRGGREALGLVPYRERSGLEAGARSVVVLQFRKEDEEPVAIRELATYLSRDLELDGPVDQSPGENDYLLHKYKPTDDDVMPLYGEDDGDRGSDHGSETTHSGSDDGDAEAEESENEEEGLSSERAKEIVEDFIANSIEVWKQKLPDLEAKKAWTVWKKTKQSRTIREALIQSSEARIQHFTERLAKMQQYLLDDIQRSEEKLREACAVMGPTIEDREQELWKVQVWERRQEPEHVVRHDTRPRQSLSHARSTVGEKGIVVHPDDRFSVSPAPAVQNLIGDDEDDEQQTEQSNEPMNLDEDIQYEADDEVYLTTPHPARASSPSVGSFIASTPYDTAFETDLGDNAASHDETLDDNEVSVALSEMETRDHSRPRPGSSQKDDEDSEKPLPSPSTFLSQRKFKTPLKSNLQPIDLTGLSDSSSPPTKKFARTPKSAAKRINYSVDPLAATASDVERWEYPVLVKNQDRLRILIKLLSELDRQSRDKLHECLRQLNAAGFAIKLDLALQDLRAQAQHASLIEDADLLIARAAKIFVQWAFPSMVGKDEVTLDEKSWDSILIEGQYRLFAAQLARILLKKESSLFIAPKAINNLSKQGSSLAPINLSSGEDSEQIQPSSQKKRKKLVARSAIAMESRKMAIERQRKFEESQNTNSSKLAAMIRSDPSHSGVEINPVKNEEDGFIHVTEGIARSMKPHQIDGTRFLWREVTAEGGDDAQGCVLAHTMGLGKTLQTIALLAALNEAAASIDPSVFKQLPPHLRSKAVQGGSRQLRILVLCPPALLPNWKLEIDLWAPNQLGNIFIVDSQNRLTHLRQVRDWKAFGGVLLIGYHMFRTAMTQSEQGERKGSRPAEEVSEIQNCLLECAEVVVADEAHTLKNQKSKIAEYADRVSAKCRIALTGTPMSNDVDEIFALISWVAPGFLGDSKEFRATFAEPIKQGLYAESTAYEKRKSTKQLYVLQAEIEPKVHRANIEVLRGSLKPKIEYVITVELTPVQAQLYRRYIRMLSKGDRTEKASQVTLFGFLGDLTLLNNHPQCLRKKLLAPPPKRKKKAKPDQLLDDSVSDEATREPTPSTVTEGSITPLNPGVLSEAEKVEEGVTATDADEDGEKQDDPANITAAEKTQFAEQIEDNLDPALSVKVQIFLELLKLSLECEDKVLLFTGSIPTLEYLHGLLEREGHKFGRIDGQTPAGSRVSMLEDFHSNKYDIMLVSTKAGGVGLNIQGANRVFIFDFGFNPSQEEQAIGRAYRLGQQKPVYVYRFVAGGTFETNIYNKQLFKASLAARVVDKKNPRRNAERNAREYIYEPKPVNQEDLTVESGKDPLVLDRLLERHGSVEEGKIDTRIRSIKTMETLQEEVHDAPLDEEEQQEVRTQIEYNKQARGKKGPRFMPTAEMRAPASTAPQSHHPSRIITLPYNASLMPPPPSTIAGASRDSHAHPQ